MSKIIVIYEPGNQHAGLRKRDVIVASGQPAQH